MEVLCRIDEALCDLLKTKQYQEIELPLLCQQAEISECDFFDYYCNLSELATIFCRNVEEEVSAQLHDVTDFSWIFAYIQGKSDLFHAYFSLPYCEKRADYKTVFFRKGLYSVAKMWFEEGCKESPEEMGEMILKEYRKLFQ